MSDPQANKPTWLSSTASNQAPSQKVRERGPLSMFVGTVVIAFIIMLLIAEYWGEEPEKFDVTGVALEHANVTDIKEIPLGFTYASSLVHVAETLLHKPGGYLTNDVFPPGVLEDNIPSWEFGALTALRDGVTALRNHIARAQSQSKEDSDLAIAEPTFYFDHKSWAFPASEAEYTRAIEHLKGYMFRLTARDAQFYSRADNFGKYLEVLEKRLGSYSNRLSSSGYRMLNEEESSSEEQQTIASVSVTDWWDIDDVFYEARGYTWAALHILKASEIDFRDILQNKTALTSLRHIIRELDDAQQEMFSPIILNGGGYGLFANYSLTLANFIARANAAAIDLRSLLQQG